MDGSTAIPKAKIGPTKLFINNEWVDSVTGAKLTTTNPATGEVLCEVAAADVPDVDRAVSAAREAFRGEAWAKMPAARRGALLFKLADLIDRHADELAALESLDNGKPFMVAKHVDLPFASAVYRYYAGWADKVHGKTIPVAGPYMCYTRHEPLGVVAGLIPWNFPLVMQAYKLAPALATGNTVVLKSAEQTPLTALRLSELVVEAGFPPGVVNILSGTGPVTGAALARHMHVDKIALTGSTATGQLVMAAAAQSNVKGVSLELGGKNPNIVFADADLDGALAGAHMGLFFNAGQVCVSGSRVYVQEEVYDTFVAKSVELAKKLVCGDPFDAATTQGPIIDNGQFDRVLRFVESGKREGATLACGGQRFGSRGYFVEPTIFADVHDEMEIAREEIFGPVMSIIKFKDEADAIRRANQSKYGLAAGIWTRDAYRAMRVSNAVRAGTVWVNCYNVFDPAAPFGGFKQSGFGRECGQYALDTYTASKTVILAE